MPRLGSINRGDGREGLRHFIFWQHAPQSVLLPPLQRSHHHRAAGKVSSPSSSASTLPRCLISTASTLLNRNTSQATPLPPSLHPAEISEHSLLNSETRTARGTSDLSLVPPSSLTPDTFLTRGCHWHLAEVSNCTPAGVKAAQGVLHARATTTLVKLTFVPKQLPNALSSTPNSSTDKLQRAQSCSLT